MRKTGQKLTLVILLFDILALNSSIIIAIWCKNGGFNYSEANQLVFLIYNIIFIITVLLYDKNVILKRRYAYQRVISQLKSSLLMLAMVSIIILLLKFTHLSRFILFGTALIFFVLRVIGGILIYKSLTILRSRGRALKNLVILGKNSTSDQIEDYCINHKYLGYNVFSVIDVELDEGNNIINSPALIKKLGDTLEDGNQVNEIIINMPLSQSAIIDQIINTADNYGKRVRLVPDYFRVLKEKYKTGMFAEMPVINVREIPLDDIIQSSIKRIFDIMFSSIVLILLSPVFVVIAILIKLSSRGPILYNPVRVGKNGETFKMYKFRSMHIDEDSNIDSKSTIKDDPRITRLGKFLRKHNIDEIPQFANVLIGDMSVIGPRPHRVWLNEKMKREVENYMVRHYLRPGITGWAQVNGWRGPTSSHQKKNERTRHDIWYLENWSFLLDLKIIYLTMFGDKVNHNAF